MEKNCLNCINKYLVPGRGAKCKKCLMAGAKSRSGGPGWQRALVFTVVARSNQEGNAITDHVEGRTYKDAVNRFIRDRVGEDLTILDVFKGGHIGLLPEVIYTADIK